MISTHEYIVYVPPLRFAEALKDLKDAGFCVLRMTQLVPDTGGFFDSIIASLPLSPPLLSGTENWDGLIDSLWGGLLDTDAQKIAVEWEGAEAFALASFENFDNAASTLATIAQGIGNAPELQRKEILFVVRDFDLPLPPPR